MQIDPGEWVSEPIIKVGAKGGDALMQQTKADKNGYTTYANLMDIETGKYILEDQYNDAFSKRQAEQSNYDKEVISVTERFNIFNNIVLGYYTKIIPVQNDLAETWTSWMHSSEESRSKSTEQHLIISLHILMRSNRESKPETGKMQTKNWMQSLPISMNGEKMWFRQKPKSISKSNTIVPICFCI